jgi:uncharacterized integral membrane protein (TIGR00697 family)
VASVLVIPLTYSLSDLISEIYGYGVMRQIIWCMLLTVGLFSISMYLLIQLPANSQFSHYTQTYDDMFHPILRIYFSNLVAIIVGMFLNSYVLIKWKILVKGRFFYIRSLLSSAIGELVFTVLVVTAVQIGVTSTSQIIEMIIVSYAVKLLFTLFSSFIMFFLKPFVIRLEGGDVFEPTLSYNPFRIG